MFDLDREVAAWTQAVHADRCRSSASVAELRDHLYCEIDRARAEGLSDERAFAAAVARLGSGAKLATEHAKDRSLLGTACAVAARTERLDSGVEHRGLLLAHGVLWAALVIATSLVLSKSATRDAITWLILFILVPSWLGSDLLLRRALRRKPTGAAR